jgi:hypothetical protein
VFTASRSQGTRPTAVCSTRELLTRVLSEVWVLLGMSIDPLVAIVTVVAVFILLLVAILRAPPEDIKKIIEPLTRWFSK